MHLIALRAVFSKPKYAALLVFFLVSLLPAYSILTNFVILDPLSVNPSVKPFSAALMLFTAALSALGFTIAAYQLIEFKMLSQGSKAGIGGTILSFFSSACPICQPVWLFWLGLGSAGAFLADFGIYVLLASIAILLFSIHLGLKAVGEGCKSKRK